MLDAPRLLHRDSTYPHPVLGTGYTDRLDRCVLGEPEAVSAEEQALITARVHRTERAAQLEEWVERRAAIQREVDWLYSQRLHQDVGKALRVLRRQLDRIDRHIAA